MSFFRRDDFVINSLGTAVPNTTVTYYVQPGLALATVYNDAAGDVIVGNPQFTDGLGHAVAYMAVGLYTITYSGAQIQTLTLTDQAVGYSGSGGSVTVFSGTPSGTIDGTNLVFTFSVPSAPVFLIVSLNYPLVAGVGYTSSWAGGTLTITYTTAPQPADTVYVQGFY